MRFGWIAPLAVGCATAASFHVDCRAGDDARDGRSPSTAWKTLARPNQTAFLPGDRLLLRAGCAWTGTLSPRGNGAAGRPISISRYGYGARPAIHGAGAVAALKLVNQSHWDIADLEITNDAPEAGLRRGVLILAENTSGVFEQIRIRNLHVHHVKGKLGADTVSKTTGGIAIEVRGKSAVRFDGVIVENNIVEHLDNTGIYTWSDFSPHPRDPQWSALRFTGVRVRGNRLHDIGKNAMGIRASLAPVIENNTITESSARLHGNAIYVFGCKDAVIQRNEVSKTKWGGLEGAAFDSDYNSEGTVIQYNYSHENGGGLVNICNNPASKAPRGYNDGTIVRYNVSQNEIERVIGFDGPATKTLIHNNTLYIGEGTAPKIVVFDKFGKAPGMADRTRFVNNVIVNAGSGSYDFGEATRVEFAANCFGGAHPANEPADEKKIAADPRFEAAGKAEAGRATVAGYRLAAGSPCAASGVTLANAPGRDYFGSPTGPTPDRGAIHGSPQIAAPSAEDLGIEARLDVEYRDGLKADLFLPRGPGPHPAVVWIHGGGWSGGDKTQLRRQSIWMASKGIAGMNIQYRLSGKAKFPAALDDARAAIAWLRAHAADARIDPARVGVAGSSAGGHLAALAGVTKPSVKAVLALNPVLDLRDTGRSPDSPVLRFLGAPCDEVPEVCEQASPVAHVRPGLPPFLILHGDADASVPYRQAEAMTRALRSAGVPVELVTGQNAPHTFYSNKTWYAASLARMEEFLTTQLLPTSAGALSQPDRERAIAELEASAAALRSAVADLTPEQWNFKSAPDRWSIAECVEHIAVTESESYRATIRRLLAAPAAEPAPRLDDGVILDGMTDRSSPRTAPETLAPKRRWNTPGELLAAFENGRREFIDYVRSTADPLRAHSAPHRAFGPLDGFQWILLASGHSRRHTLQIEEVKAALPR